MQRHAPDTPIEPIPYPEYLLRVMFASFYPAVKMAVDFNYPLDTVKDMMTLALWREAKLPGELDFILAFAFIPDQNEADDPFPARLELGLDGAETSFIASKNRHATAELFNRSVDWLAVDEPEPNPIRTRIGPYLEHYRLAGLEPATEIADLLGKGDALERPARIGEHHDGHCRTLASAAILAGNQCSGETSGHGAVAGRALKVRPLLHT